MLLSLFVCARVSKNKREAMVFEREIYVNDKRDTFETVFYNVIC